VHEVALEPALVGGKGLEGLPLRSQQGSECPLTRALPLPLHRDVLHGCQAAGKPTIGDTPPEGVPGAQPWWIEAELFEGRLGGADRRHGQHAEA
jgi:hypothetical protein